MNPPLTEFNQEVPLTLQGIQVLRFFLPRSEFWHAGYDVAKATRMASGSMYPLLKRLEGYGLLISKWQEPTVNNRRRYHIYQMTEKGCRIAQKALDDLKVETEFYRAAKINP